MDHDAAVEESKKKLAELIKDKPLWDEEALKRATAAHTEEARREKACHDAAEAAAEAEHRCLAEAAAEQERCAAEAASRAQQNAQHIVEERRETWRQQRLRWSPWNPSRAILRYVELLQVFDQAKFTPE